MSDTIKYHAQRRLLKRSPTLILTSDELLYATSANGSGKISIKWEEVESVDITQGGNSYFLSIHLKDEAKYLQQVNILTRTMMKSNRKRLGSSFVIPQSLLNQPLIHVKSEIQKRIPGQSKHEMDD